jgi:xylan 1,4-beta-xylosidase
MQMWSRRELVKGASGLAASTLIPTIAAAQSNVETVSVDLTRDIGRLDHIWSRCAGSDRAAITLREDWRKDLDRFHKEAGLERVRFHNIFGDELGVWAFGDKPNFQNVDAVYDGLLAHGVQPFVELSFLPRKLASGSRKFGFYGANVSTPTSLEDWSSFIQTFVRHLIGRYGVAEVRQWCFEVWNEPDLSFFFTGKQEDYFQLYKATAAAIKAVDPALRVGGPSTSAVQWLEPFLAFCAANDCAVDFVTTHIYAGDDQTRVFGEPRGYKQNQVIPAAMAMARQQIDATPYKGAELWLSEWSSDSPAMIAHVITGCLPFCHAMSHWTLTNQYEEVSVMDFVLKEGDNGWGMFARGGVPKPQFNTYKLLNRLGDRRLSSTGPALASRSSKGASVMVWNLADVQQAEGIPGRSTTRTVSGEPKTIEVSFKGASAGRAVAISYVDMERGSPYPKWRALGSPQYPTPAQMQMIRDAAELAPPEKRRLSSRETLTLQLPAEGVALIELI